MTLARDFMTKKVVTVAPETTIKQIARILLFHGISAVPVIDSEGTPIGIVSEGDLVAQTDGDQESGREWWLERLAEGDPLSPVFLGTIRDSSKTAREVMSSPVIGVDEGADIHEIAKLLTEHHIKRAPVLHNGRITGIVSRADILHELVLEKSFRQGTVRKS